jgi:hypothetical protein
VSNANPNCSITVAVGANAVYENHQIVFTNTTSGAKIPTNPTEIPFTLPSFIFLVGADSNMNQYCTAGSCATDPESGIHGADALCQESATNANLSGTFKALLVSSTRYPCDANGQCGGNSASDWVLKPNYTYVNTARGTFGTTNSNGVFLGDTEYSNMYYADGTTSANGEEFFDGINAGLFTPQDVTGWAYANVNNSVTGYVDMTCNDWRLNDSGITAAAAGNLNATWAAQPPYTLSGWQGTTTLYDASFYAPWQYNSSCESGGYMLCVQQGH